MAKFEKISLRRVQSHFKVSKLYGGSEPHDQNIFKFRQKKEKAVGTKSPDKMEKSRAQKALKLYRDL